MRESESIWVRGAFNLFALHHGGPKRLQLRLSFSVFEESELLAVSTPQFMRLGGGFMICNFFGGAVCFHFMWSLNIVLHLMLNNLFFLPGFIVDVLMGLFHATFLSLWAGQLVLTCWTQTPHVRTVCELHWWLQLTGSGQPLYLPAGVQRAQRHGDTWWKDSFLSPSVLNSFSRFDFVSCPVLPKTKN